MAEQEITERSLTRRQELFIAYYIQTLNATQAARKAGYEDNQNIRQTGADNLTKPHIKNRINQILKENAPSGPRVTRECADVALQSADDLIDFDDQGRPYINLQKLADRDLMHTVESVHYSEKGRLIVKRHSKMDAIDKLLRLMGMFPTAFNGQQTTNNVTVNMEVSKEDMARAVLAALRAGQAVPAIEGEYREEGSPDVAGEAIDLGPQGDDY